jgi:hypothetical protein
MAFNSQLCQGVVVVLIIVITLCTLVNYRLIAYGHTNHIPTNYKDDIITSAYFTTSTLSATGMGDILPATNEAKIAIAVQQGFVFLLAMGLLTVSCSAN